MVSLDDFFLVYFRANQEIQFLIRKKNKTKQKRNVVYCDDGKKQYCYC